MHLVYDIDAVLSYLRGYLHLVHQCLDVVHAVVGRGVQLVDAVRASFAEGHARLALAAGFHIGSGMGAVYRLGEDTGGARLADAAGSAEEVGVGQLSPEDGVLQGPGSIVLTYQGLERVRTVFSG